MSLQALIEQADSQDMLLPPRIIETERLRLRFPEPEDADAIFNLYAADPEVTRYLMWQPHADIEATRSFIQSRIRAWELETAFPWTITLKDTGQVLGMIELRVKEFSADMGFVVGRPFWNMGYSTEATRAVVDWAIAQPEIYRVWAVCDVENTASARVLEKAGMAREGILRRWMVRPNISSEPRDCLCYAKTR